MEWKLFDVRVTFYGDTGSKGGESTGKEHGKIDLNCDGIGVYRDSRYLSAFLTVLMSLQRRP